MNEDTPIIPSFTLPGLRARTNFVIAITLIHFTLIGCLLVWGDDTNSLHTSAMAWAWGAYIALMSAFLFGVNIDVKNLLTTNKTP
jgi:ABC-type antimicrobial peptide transport system permease subunit